MMTAEELTVAARISDVLDHLGIERAHFAASMLADVAEFAQKYPERIASLTLVCPPRLDASLRALGDRLQIIAGDQGRPAATVREAIRNLPDAKIAWLGGYFSPPWADPVADFATDVEIALSNMLVGQSAHETTESERSGEGTVAGISYRCKGAGTPLVLLPLSLAPSQWEPLFLILSARYRIIALSGPELGFLAMLESRGHSAGYLNAVRRVIDVVQVRRGEIILEVGCGSGVLDRWLAHHTQRNNTIIGMDVNRYLLREASALAMRENLSDVITFHQGNAEAIPFPDDHVDVALSFTVLEEGKADRMLRELVRVTKPGGRVAVMVRAIDIPLVVNIHLRPDLKSKTQIPRGFVGSEGCADASLYKRFHELGLTDTTIWPQFAASRELDTPQAHFAHGAILGALDENEVQEWKAGIAQAVSEGTYFIAQPFHCAVGTKSPVAS